MKILYCLLSLTVILIFSKFLLHIPLANAQMVGLCTIKYGDGAYCMNNCQCTSGSCDALLHKCTSYNPNPGCGYQYEPACLSDGGQYKYCVSPYTILASGYCGYAPSGSSGNKEAEQVTPTRSPTTGTHTIGNSPGNTTGTIPSGNSGSCSYPTTVGAACLYSCGCGGSLSCTANGCQYSGNTTGTGTTPAYEPKTYNSSKGQFCGTRSNGDKYLCDSGLNCLNEKCIEYTDPGNSCDGNTIKCSAGYHCDGTDTGKFCVKELSAGQDCDISQGGADAICTNGYHCEYNSSLNKSICEVHNAGTGDSCNLSQGTLCQAGYRCTNQTGGPGICQGSEGKDCSGPNSGTCEAGLTCTQHGGGANQTWTCDKPSSNPTPSPTTAPNNFPTVGTHCDNDYDCNLPNHFVGYVCKNNKCARPSDEGNDPCVPKSDKGVGCAKGICGSSGFCCNPSTDSTCHGENVSPTPTEGQLPPGAGRQCGFGAHQHCYPSSSAPRVCGQSPIEAVAPPDACPTGYECVADLGSSSSNNSDTSKNTNTTGSTTGTTTNTTTQQSQSQGTVQNSGGGKPFNTAE